VKDGPHTWMWMLAYWVFLVGSFVFGLGSLALFTIGMLAVQTALAKLA
jgi:hypothetical protein